MIFAVCEKCNTEKDKYQYLYRSTQALICPSSDECVFLLVSGRVAKEVIEASSKIQREPPEVRR